MLRFEKTTMVDAENALTGRSKPVLTMPFFHRVTGDRLDREFPGSQTAYLAAGCFWGVEKLYWSRPGVLSTAVGYMGGFTPNPTYEEVCTGQTGHAETVRVVFDPAVTSFAELVRIFLENHDPTQLNRQGADVGTQYRSSIFYTGPEQEATAAALCEDYQAALTRAGYGRLVTDIVPAGDWYYAEDYHQQYLEANPYGYCPVHATGVKCGTP
ncbi:MAG: peptide-methionine (S)-S-oxide reductase MsrA [Propionibacteriaceae bacterium]|uniref:Peptide methionine sulfoxide reductase MsrA n=1 Tax=Propionibacterium ruminifibrarum TaxID=1962131 RepID=A0A375I194_9ACTN|nr:peptide-methionine (S)-S-oxide reductase MsrA [Propionibacterium ruminifibrarum]MBE6477198.1 peptide-methionine (S)-S-oxide reductase MsrA [Propionibacteriaceae bacterium]SPF68574.1 peptide-methionine (S)-S-oxide reductase [Propionibacterium ruminifibrarum]